ncbi:methyltransferase domain-containing protein [Synechococcus sp. PCC 6312]|uniref:methyltransferase domain-containing protein n=1 Tax=Synechococcus sp. (strain ATCC 27167 / PCC 6312) TaxID=195253 RepID=UPI00029ED49F|nr:methyltransferase domain-containing protein [Synechococcus sp. PCC 6312]AFY62541.1 methyltransferase family protein [Synechococcus sp. PCC 6312]
MHQSSIDKMQLFVNKYLNNKLSEELYILDLGSQNIGGSYRPIFHSPNWKYIGLDLEAGENVDILLRDPYMWNEINSNSVDVLISGQTLEHIQYFWLTILEISRVLKPGGLCCLIAPSTGYEHRYPVDCWRFYPDGMMALANFAQLEVLEAFTQWENENYNDGSNVWHDSVLIARKPLTVAKQDSDSIELYTHLFEVLTPSGQLDLYKFELINLKRALSSIDLELKQLKAQNNNLLVTHAKAIENIEKSFFWKLRTRWFLIKNFFIKLFAVNFNKNKPPKE